MKIRLSCIFFFTTVLFSVVNAFCQNSDNWRVGHVTPTQAVLTIDSLSIIPETFHIQGVDSSRYRLDPLAARLIILDSSLIGKSLFYQYQVFGFNYARPYFHKSLSQIEPWRPHFEPAVSSIRPVSDIQEEDRLLSTGSIARGVSVGNNQDVVLNSALNLQLSGKLSEDVDIMAVITDKNIPIQPEGNTQVLQDFDKVFINVKYKNRLSLCAGDVDLLSPNSRFLSVSRSLLGMNLEVKSPLSHDATLRNEVGGGVAQGKYVRQTVIALDGVQGPYKLYGAENEVSIVIVAGSERVYVDGSLLTRGQENDYTIDYNTAELTFTPKMLMVSEKRIIVEFEYTDKHFTRYDLYSYNEVTTGQRHRLKLQVNFFQEQDLKNQSIQPELDNARKLFLSGIGDATADAYYPYVDTASYSSDEILYVKKDTLVEGITYRNIYEYSTNSSQQLYRLGFTYMGTHKGTYILLQSNANGRVFAWVAPKDGIMQGDYSPVQLLGTPQLVQMTTIAAEYRSPKQTSLKTEMAISNNDANTFSKKDDGDNVGFAYFIDVDNTHHILNKQKDTTNWRMLSSLQWQFVHKNFHSVESFREVEFARNYNLSEDYSSLHSEQMLQGTWSMINPKVSDTRYTLNWFSRFGDVQAIRNEVVSKNHYYGFVLNTQTSFLHTADSVQTSNYWTSRNVLSYRFHKMEFGATDLLEKNIFKDRLFDTVRPNSYAFNEAVFYFKNTDSIQYKFNVSYKYRLEAIPKADNLSLNLRVQEVSLQFGVEKIKNQHLGMNLTFRNQQLKDSLEHFFGENYFVGNLEYTGRFFRNVLVLNTYYEAGSGMELRKTFTYLKVADGQGVYVWNDYNGNGIEELDEFEVSAFQDEADYVKVWLAGTEYVNTYNNQFTQSVQLRPAAIWSNRQGFRRFLARFANTAMFRSQQKNSGALSAHSFNSFYYNMNDTNLVSSVLSFNNTLSFNNSSSKFGCDMIVQKLQNKSLLYYGYEQNAVEMQQVVLKSAMCKFLSVQTNYQHSVTDNQSALLISRCYTIEQHQVGGKLQGQFQNRYYGNLEYNYISKRNLLGEEKMWEHDVTAEVTFRLAKKGTATTRVQYIYIQGLERNNATVSYLMLNGLNGGQNALWSLAYQVSINDYLQLSLQYDGRASEGHRVVHTGNVTLKAQF